MCKHTPYILLSNTKQVFFSSDQHPIADRNWRSNEALAHVILGEEFELAVNTGDQEHAVLTRSKHLSSGNNGRCVVFGRAAFGELAFPNGLSTDGIDTLDFTLVSQ